MKKGAKILVILENHQNSEIYFSLLIKNIILFAIFKGIMYEIVYHCIAREMLTLSGLRYFCLIWEGGGNWDHEFLPQALIF